MANNPQNLLFHIDVDELKAIQQQLGATEAQLLASYNRALSRTAQTLRTLSKSLIKSDLEPKSINKLRQRIKHFKIRSTSKLERLDEVKLWFGLNDVPISLLRGTMSRIGSKKNSKGARFKPKGKIQSKDWRSGFIAAPMYRTKSIYQRTSNSRYPIKEADVSINERTQISIEDEIFDRTPDIFFRHFQTDLKGRVKMGLNRKNWHE
ncbi:MULTISPECIES: hypothetical protein [Vibrio]|uniref:hypothetical protein n=1 Tax=Vibrio TaxID=662 RepID=UPI000E0BAA08|nr:MULTISPECIES: hypothetical protein [Vibrio]MCX9470710.1 hypothetical protein [Vibrio cholerae]MCX9484194.1 hypothetical protein [Vibrio cholerae]MCX9491254.1 hypothetical protein [Vibrio cholerae]MDV2341702.1 hypothetical protein [Vibrio cholerae]HDZ3692821.1 hypothetical protein [Vibrio cholerae]